MHNAKALAVKIKARLGAQLTRACEGTLVLDSFLAALISVEDSQLNADAYRFERAVYDKLKKLRNPLIFWRREWNGITQADLQFCSDDALVNLATSWGYTQIMGWWTIPLSRVSPAPVTVGDLRDPETHLKLAVRLLHLVALRQLKTYTWGDVLRIWNSGSPQGKTYDPDYVPHALAVMQEYRRLQSGLQFPPRTTTNALPVEPAPGTPPASSS